MTTTYNNIDRLTWNELIAELKQPYVPPVTAHLPIQPIHSPDFVQVDCALNVIRRRVHPRLSTREWAHYKEMEKLPTLIVQFALDDPPFVPDLHRTRLSLAEECLPVARAEYFAWDILYRFEYFCMPTTDEKQSVLCILCRVKNEGDKQWPAHVRAKVNIQRESDICDYHYVPFYWDATKWKPCDLVRLEDDRLVMSGGEIGKVMSGDFSCAWEESARFAETDYNQKFECQRPYFVTPSLRLPQLDNVLHFEKALDPGQEAEFALLLLTNYEGTTELHRKILRDADVQSCRARALTHFHSQLPAKRTELVFPTERWDDIFTALQFSTLQLLVKFPGENNLMPTQGGTSERHFVWVWEAVCMLLPMLKLGYVEPVRQALGFIFALQDGGYPPEGRFTSLEGAVGTTGPRWMSSTGAALALASDYYRYTHDRNFLREYLPRVYRAADWLARELRATRKLNTDGSRPLWYGLMPFGCANDGDIGYIVAVTDAYTFWGLEKMVHLLESEREPRATEFRQLLEEYRNDLAKTIEGLTHPDGRIDRAIRTGDKDELLSTKFEDLVNVSHLAYGGVLSVESAAFHNFMVYFEQHVADGLFLGPMDREMVYIGINETMWQEFYLRLGHWKKSFAAVYTNLRYGMTPYTFQVQERFSKTNPEFTPWQPNGSGNGRMLLMILNSLYYEHDGVVTLLGNIPFAWLQRNGTTALRNLRTPHGAINLQVVLQKNRECAVTLTAGSAEAMPRQILFPNYFQASAVSSEIHAVQANLFAVPAGTTNAEFTLRARAEE